VVAPPPSQETEDRARESLANIRRAVARKDTDKYGAIRLVDQLIVQFDRTAAAKDAVEYRKVLEAMPLEKDGEEAPAPAGDDAPAPDRPPAADAPGAGE
jgi:hypothetical protein